MIIYFETLWFWFYFDYFIIFVFDHCKVLFFQKLLQKFLMSIHYFNFNDWIDSFCFISNLTNIDVNYSSNYLFSRLGCHLCLRCFAAFSVTGFIVTSMCVCILLQRIFVVMCAYCFFYSDSIWWNTIYVS